MKNDEILISVSFKKKESETIKERLMSFLVKKDITLKNLIQGIYYGLKKRKKNIEKGQIEYTEKFELSDIECFDLFETFIKTHKQLIILYTINGENKKIDFSSIRKDPSDNTDKKVFDFKLTDLGIVTSSVIVIEEYISAVDELFSDNKETDTFKKSIVDNNLEYNISTRRLNVIEPAVIDIIPPGDMPQDQKNSWGDVFIPPAISLVGMLGVRYIASAVISAKEGDAASAAMNSSMMVMTVAMPLVSMVNSSYNHAKQSNQHKQSVASWKENYENYISKVIETIAQWQSYEIKYLNKVYPDIKTLLAEAANISPTIFSRSQSDNDFMRILLGKSDEIRPLFEIKAEKKDAISYDVKYKLRNDDSSRNKGLPFIDVILPEKKKGRFGKFMENHFSFKKKKFSETSDEENRFLLTELPYNFANTQNTGFRFLTDYYHGEKDPDREKPPLLIDLKNMGTLGVIYKDDDIALGFVKHIVFQLAYYHSPEDLQMVFFFNKSDNDKERNEKMEDYAYLPHTNELFDNLSQFVFDKKSAGDVFIQLQAIMSERARSSNSDEKDKETENEKLTQIVCFVLDDYDIKESAFSKYIPDVPKEGEDYVNSLGLTFVFLCKQKGMLPKYCGNIIQLEGNPCISKRYNLLSHDTLSILQSSGAENTDQTIEYTHFDNDFTKYIGQELSLAFKQISSIYYTRIAEKGKVPSMVTIFELYKDVYGLDPDMIKGSGLTDLMNKNWSNKQGEEENDVTNNLKIAMGKNEHGITYLDLHENADGPHMLVAGTTGSGKSETIITYLLGLCVKYSPMDLNLMLVDMKGGGFSDRLGKLPHCVGTVSNIAGENEGISAVYMLKRFLSSLKAEIHQRQLILADLGVDNTDAYIRVMRKLKKIHDLENISESETERAKLIKDIRDGGNQKQIQYIDGDISKLKTLSHLILVVDEFTELKRFSSESNDIDLIAEITTIARVGRTLGLHIILVSQNIEGAINDDIRVNTKSKICLKVATKQASKEMLGTTDAAAATMPGHGRAYLLVGTGSRYEYFQSAYTGENQNTNIEPTVSITAVSKTGKFDKKFYISNKDNDIIKAEKEKVNAENTQLKCVVSKIMECAKDFEKPQEIFKKPLAKLIKENDGENQWNGVV